eukprot:1897512-Rhodomonas_salina.4
MHGGVSVVSTDSGASWRVSQGQCPGYKDGESGVSGNLYCLTTPVLRPTHGVLTLSVVRQGWVSMRQEHSSLSCARFRGV